MAIATSDVSYRSMVPVKYSSGSNSFVDYYNSKPANERVGEFWDDTRNNFLTTVKHEIKSHYLSAQDYRCAYCKQRVVVEHNAAWDTEHIIPKDKYPDFLFVPENLCISCKDCNRIKSNKNVLKNKSRKTYPDKPGDYILCHPHFHEYSKHIRIVREAVLYLPITDEGRALIEICGLLRFVLKFAGYEHDDENIGEKIVNFGTELQNAQTTAERIMIMHIMKTMLDERLRTEALKAMGTV